MFARFVLGVLFVCAACHYTTIPVCGNNIAQSSEVGGEECDDGNRIDGDGCNAFCQLEFCGDEILSVGEQCDDGNTIAGDGCGAACQTENLLCGDGNIDLAEGEECDDGAANGTAGNLCGVDCKIVPNPLCGNGTIDAVVGEVCDDGNTSVGDGCRADCFGTELCGDQLVDTAIGEECDPPGGTCNLDCTALDCGGLGVEGSPCAQSSDCCQLSNFGCIDTNADSVGDTCGVEFQSLCGVAGSAHVCACADSLDNDADGVADFDDPFCLAPTDDDEGASFGAQFGDNPGPNGAIECPFDGNSGPGNDGDCYLFLPNGCDCGGCCEIDSNSNLTAENIRLNVGIDCRIADLNNNPGTEGGPCTFVDNNADGIADDSGGCGTVVTNGTTINLNCLLDGDGTTAYCSTCIGCQTATQDVDPTNDFCVNDCNCCERCVSGIQSPDCDPALADVNNDDVADLFDLDSDGVAETASRCSPIDPGNICETNALCTPNADPALTGCLVSEACVPSSGDPNVNVCFQPTCDSAADCDATSFCARGCCVPLP